MLDQFVSEDTADYEINAGSMEEYLSNKKLYIVFKKLTKKQQKILYLAYVEGLIDREIAMKLNVSRQYISKIRKIALLLLRTELEESV